MAEVSAYLDAAVIEPIRKPVSKKNKVSKEWLAFRRQWLKDNPPTIWPECWTCGICGQPVDLPNLDLDHIVDRSVDPSRRLDPTNIQPSHHSCNIRKKTG